ncbi:uncharacterized protein LOC135820746 [Sycon ciliatum]|uniref:uncharacterized protein LOC135820746 n=1 Tax=Sycon ciliatum TaxID=27933 RepID=UPI0031F70609
MAVSAASCTLARSVFVSYFPDPTSDQGEENQRERIKQHQHDVHQLTEFLMAHGVKCEVDHLTHAFTCTDDWVAWLEECLTQCDYTLMLVTPAYCKHFSARSTGPPSMEGLCQHPELFNIQFRIIRSALLGANAAKQRRFIPVFLGKTICKRADLPIMLQGMTSYHLKLPLALRHCEESPYTDTDRLYNRITGQKAAAAPELGHVRKVAVKPRGRTLKSALNQPSRPPAASASAETVAIPAVVATSTPSAVVVGTAVHYDAKLPGNVSTTALPSRAAAAATTAAPRGDVISRLQRMAVAPFDATAKSSESYLNEDLSSRGGDTTAISDSAFESWQMGDGSMLAYDAIPSRDVLAKFAWHVPQSMNWKALLKILGVNGMQLRKIALTSPADWHDQLVQAFLFWLDSGASRTSYHVLALGLVRCGQTELVERLARSLDNAVQQLQ